MDPTTRYNKLYKAPVTRSHVSTALAQESCLFFQSALRSQENHDIFFREEGPVTVSLQRSWLCYRVCRAFNRVTTEFLLAILCALMTLSRRSRCMHYGFTFAILCDPTASTGDAILLLRRCSQWYYEQLVFCIFLGRCGISVRTLFWCDRGLKI